MTRSVFEKLIALLGLVFMAFFAVVVVPPLIESGDIVGAFAAGFVNPYSSGYSFDAIVTGFILIAWVLYERHVFAIRHGWVAIVLCFVPGVATAFAYYLVLRLRRENARRLDNRDETI